MALDVDIPLEINDYQEKIVFGMSLRQLVCSVLAVVLGIGTYFLCTKMFNMTMDSASYVIIVEALPLMAFGFIRKDGQPFEKFFMLVIRQRLGNHKLPIHHKPLLQEDSNVERKSSYAWIFEKESTGSGKPVLSKQERRAEARIREAIIFTADKTSSQRKRQKTRAKIKAAQKEYGAAKRREKEEIKATGGTEKLG